MCKNNPEFTVEQIKTIKPYVKCCVHLKLPPQTVQHLYDTCCRNTLRRLHCIESSLRDVGLMCSVSEMGSMLATSTLVDSSDSSLAVEVRQCRGKLTEVFTHHLADIHVVLARILSSKEIIQERRYFF